MVDVPETDQIDQEETIPAPTKNPAKRKRKDIQFELKKEQLSVLIKTVFDIAGSREGMEVWKITQKESDLIADPLTGILNKNPVIGKITSEYGDLIALVVAVATVLLPRVMMQYSMKKTKEGVKPYVAISEPNRKPTNPGKHNETGKNGNHLEQSTRKPSFTGQDAGNQLHNLIPSIQ